MSSSAESESGAVRRLLRRLRGNRPPVDPRHAELEAARAAIIEQHGEWTAHNIHVGSRVYTRGEGVFGDEFKVRRAVRLVEDLVRRPWSELRIADLGCNEGLYACEFALRGASVLGVEGHEATLSKTRFAMDALGLERLELLHSDVRGLSREAHGAFDVVLCWGCCTTSTRRSCSSSPSDCATSATEWRSWTPR